MKRRGVLSVTHEAFTQWIAFGAGYGATFRVLRVEDDPFSGTIKLICEGDEMPECPEGAIVAQVPLPDKVSRRQVKA